MSSNLVAPGDNELSITDLGPLAWVLDELRKSLDGATKAMRRFVRDAELARGSDLTELDGNGGLGGPCKISEGHGVFGPALCAAARAVQ